LLLLVLKYPDETHTTNRNTSGVEIPSLLRDR